MTDYFTPAAHARGVTMTNVAVGSESNNNNCQWGLPSSIVPVSSSFQIVYELVQSCMLC
jgi:hypothetical protein